MGEESSGTNDLKNEFSKLYIQLKEKDKRMKNLTYNITENLGRGDCLFLSLFDFLSKNKVKFKDIPNDAQGLRTRIVDYIISNNDNWNKWFNCLTFNTENNIPQTSNADDLKTTYKNYMSIPGIYGTFTELCAASEIFGFNGKILQENIAENFDCIDFGQFDINSGIPKLFLLFTGDLSKGHFRDLDILKPRVHPLIQNGIYYLDKDVANYKSNISITNVIPKNDDSQSNQVYIICNRCTHLKKCKGKNGLKRHYQNAHIEFLSDLLEDSATSSAKSNEFLVKLSQYKQSVRVLIRIPKGARLLAAKKLEELINLCISNDDKQSWENLLSFSYIALHVPKRSSKKKNLTSIVKKNIANFNDSLLEPSVKPKKLSLSKRVESKMSEGDVKGAVKILSSNDEFAPQNSETLKQLIEKHPSPSRPLNLPSPPKTTDKCLIVTESEVIQAIFGFPNGSASGIDGLRPQLLKDMLSKETGELGSQLLLSITKLSNIMLEGKINESIISVLYGASLCALNKKVGGLRPIAVGNTFRRLTAKLACKSIRGPIGDYLRPHQLGFATKGGCEAAIHATRTYMKKNVGSSKVLLKIDFKNAFNSMERDEMLNAIKEKTPEIFPFLYQCYSSNSDLFFGNEIISSQVGAQQGDPAGPLAFSLTIHPIIESLLSELNIWYLDDGTLAGDPETVLRDFKTVIDSCSNLSLEINPVKCELFFFSSVNQSVYEKFADISTGIKIVNNDLSLLGAPLTDSSTEIILNKKLEELWTLFDRLKDLNSHTAYFLLKHCFAIPKLVFLLRTCPAWKFPDIVNKYDDRIRTTLQEITNTTLVDDKWILSTLPTRFGGLGIRRVCDITIPSFLSSVNGVFDLICTILPTSETDLIDIPFYTDAIDAWNVLCPDTLHPENPSSQQQWDIINIKRITSCLNLNSEVDLARHNASLVKESSAWLTALPAKSVGTLMDNNAFRISIALRLGCNICIPHKCKCGYDVDCTGIHGLSCRKSAGRFNRHYIMNDIIKRTFSSAEVPSLLEPSGLSRDDGKRPDGMTSVPWKNGQCLVWDATCIDTLAPSYLKWSSKEAGLAAEKAALRKREKHTFITDQNFIFLPFAVETLGPWCKEAKEIIETLGTRIASITGEQKSKLYITQRISIAIQRSNAACVMGTLPISSKMDEIFFIL